MRVGDIQGCVMMKTSALFLVFYMGIVASCASQERRPTYSDAYNLHLTMQDDSTIVYSWRGNAAYANYAFPVPYVNWD